MPTIQAKPYENLSNTWQEMVLRCHKTILEDSKEHIGSEIQIES